MRYGEGEGAFIDYWDFANNSLPTPNGCFLLNAGKPKLELREGYKFISSLVQQFSLSCCLVIF